MKTQNLFTRLLIVSALVVISFAFFLACHDKTNSDNVVARQFDEKEATLTTVYNIVDVGSYYEVNINLYTSVLVLDKSVDNFSEVYTLLSNSFKNGSVIKVNFSKGKITNAKSASNQEQAEFYKNIIPLDKSSVYSGGNVSSQNELITNQKSRIGALPVTMTLAKANEIFQTIVKNQCTPQNFNISYCIPFAYASDGCYARAHWMRWIMENSYKLSCYKCFVYGNLSAYSSKNRCCVSWGYHVAPLVYVAGQYSYEAYILDPSLFTKPVPLATWLSANKNTGCNKNASISSYQIVDGRNYAPIYNSSRVITGYWIDDNLVNTNQTLRNYASYKGCTPI